MRRRMLIKDLTTNLSLIECSYLRIIKQMILKYNLMIGGIPLHSFFKLFLKKDLNLEAILKIHLEEILDQEL